MAVERFPIFWSVPHTVLALHLSHRSFLLLGHEESCFLWLIKTIFSLAKELYGLSPGGIMDPILLSSHFRQKFQMACPNFNTLHKFILFPEPSTSNTPLLANQFLFFIMHLLPFLPLSGISRACQNDCSPSAVSESLFHPPCPFLSSPLSHLQSLLTPGHDHFIGMS